MIIQTIVDELYWMDLPESVRAKKIRGKQHYENRYARIKYAQARKKRTRASDISPRRTGEGMPANHHLRMLNRSEILPIIRRKQKSSGD